MEYNLTNLLDMMLIYGNIKVFFVGFQRRNGGEPIPSSPGVAAGSSTEKPPWHPFSERPERPES